MNVFFFNLGGGLLCSDDSCYRPGLKLEFFSEMQIIELPTHPYYVGVQFHPEFKSRPGRPSPLFVGNYSSYSSRRWVIHQDDGFVLVAFFHYLSTDC